MVATILIVMTLSPALTVLESAGHDGGSAISDMTVYCTPYGRLGSFSRMAGCCESSTLCI